MSTVNLRAIDDVMRDYYPSPGEPIKQWVVDERELDRWARATCPTVAVWPHRDNTGAECRNAGYADGSPIGPPDGDRDVLMPWHYLDHDSCYWCGNLHTVTADRTDIAAWREERDARKAACCTDPHKLSDEIAGDRRSGDPALADNPMLTMLRKGPK